MASFTERMIRAAKRDVNLYEEVEADKNAMGQAMGVVILSSVAAGIGTIGTTGLKGLLFGPAASIGGWFIRVFLTYFIGTRLLAAAPCSLGCPGDWELHGHNFYLKPPLILLSCEVFTHIAAAEADHVFHSKSLAIFF